MTALARIRQLLEGLAAQPPAQPRPDQGAATPVTPELAQRIRTLIESEVYEYRERTMFWEETGGVTEEIARLATRGALEALADTGPRILCAHTRPGSHTTICDLPAGHGDHDGATGYGERVSWPAATEATQTDCSRTTPNNSAEQPAGPNGLPS